MQFSAELLLWALAKGNAHVINKRCRGGDQEKARRLLHMPPSHCSRGQHTQCTCTTTCSAYRTHYAAKTPVLLYCGTQCMCVLNCRRRFDIRR